jgi:hypothetical protein
VIEVGKAVKRAVVALIDGNLTYGGDNVPLFDGKVEDNAMVYAMIDVADQTTENSCFDMEVNEFNLVFDLVSIREATAKSEVIEEVEGQIRALINPTINEAGFSLSDPLRLVSCEFAGATGDEVRADGDKIAHSKRITFRTIVIQS